MVRCVSVLIFISFISLSIGKQMRHCIDHICWRDGSYPLKEIRRLYYSDANFIKTFGKMLEPFEKTMETKKSCDLCNTIFSLTFRPLSFVKDGSLSYIVHTDKFNHTITSNLCHSSQENSQCMSKSGNPFNYEYTCTQKKSSIQVLLFNVKNRKFTQDLLIYNSACMCESLRPSF